MRPIRRRRFPRALSSVVLGLAAGCAAAGDDGSADEQNITAGAEAMDIFGQDRVGAALRGNLDAVPGNFAAFEKVFKVGRACAKDAKEIFVVQEAQTRSSGASTHAKIRLPRAVIAGCAVEPDASGDPLRPSYSLMSALFSVDNGATDNMVVDHVETIALDESTGEYNFYAFDGTGPSKPGKVTRTMRDATGKVTARVWERGKGTRSIAPPLDCFSCHVNGGPLMNELNDAWTNWVSFRDPLPKDLEMSGETLAIVSQAQTASDLEQIIVSATNATVQGSTSETGFGPRTLARKDPGHLATLLESVFCETELNYRSGHTAANLGVPLELFVDPGSAEAASFVQPPADPADVFPFLLPIRSAHDKEVEIFLQIQGILSPNTVLAIRLLDDENDVFSSARCGVLGDVTAGLPSEPAAVDAKVREVLSKKLGSSGMSDVRKAYVAKLLATDDGDASLEPVKSAYLEDLTRRFQASVARLSTADGKRILKAREAARKLAAKKMFPEGGPLPILDPK